MLYTSKDAEQAAVLQVANEMCAAIRTAPKTKGQDFLDCCIVTGQEQEDLAKKMEELSDQYGAAFLKRDAGNVRASGAVVVVGVKNVRRGLDALCGYCGFENCAACADAGAECVYGPMDLGIAVGSAVAVASNAHVDNRVMFSAGRAAMELGFLGSDYGCMVAIPLSVSGKSPYFDRKSSK